MARLSTQNARCGIKLARVGRDPGELWELAEYSILGKPIKGWLVRRCDAPEVMRIISVEDFPQWEVVLVRPVEPYNEDDGGDCMMTLNAFANACAGGSFVDYDGFGHLATESEVSDTVTHPSAAVEEGWIDTIRKLHPWATHVCWYNR